MQFFLRILLITSAVYLWLDSNLHFFLVKLGGHVLLITGLLWLIFFAAALFACICMIVQLIRRKEWQNRLNFVLLPLPALAILLLCIPGWHADENTFQSKVIFRACYEGTMNDGHLRLREDGSFENDNIGVMGYVTYHSGTRKQSGDTFFLKYDGEKLDFLGDTLLITKEEIFKIEADTLQPSFYYLGYCQGLN